ncbi:DUF5675 family protein [Helicobacter sp. T3_23-1059]
MPKLNPLLESDAVECAHKGKIVAFSNNKLLEVDGSCVLTKQDLLQAQIIGCQNNILGVATPCKAIVTILDSALSNTLIINGDSAIIAQQISQIFTDNGVPLQFKNGATPKAKDIFELDEEVAEFDNAKKGNENAESMSESSAESSNQSNADSNKSNTESNTKSSKDSQTQKEQMVLEVVRKWEYSPNNENFAYWATISEFTLKKDDEIVKDSQGKDIKGYIIEPAGINLNPKHKVKVAGNEVVVGTLPPEQQQITSGSDTKIPAGEYNVFWRYSSKRTYLKTNFEFYKTLQNIEKQTNEKFLCNCSKVSASLANIYPYHTHILPEFINTKGRNTILIHNGSGGGDSEGCLLPANQFRNELSYDKRKVNNKIIDIVSITIGTNDFIHILMNELVKHDTESFKNYKDKQPIKNFLVKIREEQNIIFDTDKKINQFLSIKSKEHK